jgi:hypothetical protein
MIVWKYLLIICIAATFAASRLVGASHAVAKLQPSATPGPLANDAVTLVGASTIRLLDDGAIEVWLSSSTPLSVSVDLFGLTGAEDRFWPVRFHSDEAALAPPNVQQFRLTIADAERPPPGRYRGTLTIRTSDGRSQLFPIILEIPWPQTADLVVAVPPVVALSGSLTATVTVTARDAHIRKLRVQPISIVGDDGQTMPTDLLRAPQPIDLDEHATRDLLLELAPLHDWQATGARTFTVTLMIVADNVPPVKQLLVLLLPGSGIEWQLVTPHVTPVFDTRGRTEIVSFDLWFTPHGSIPNTVKASLLRLTDADGGVWLPDRTIITDTTRPSSVLMGRQISLFFTGQSPLARGIYTGTLTLSTSSETQFVQFILVVPPRTIHVVAIDSMEVSPRVDITLTRLFPTPWMPCFIAHRAGWPWFFCGESPRGALPGVGLLPDRAASGLRWITVPPAVVANADGDTAMVVFDPAPSVGGLEPNALHVDVRTVDLSHTGTFTGATVIQSPDLPTHQPLQMRLRVSDLWVWPLLVIMAGVICGDWLARRRTLRQHPEYQRLRIEQLCAEALALRAGVAPQPLERELLAKLEDARARLVENDVAAAAAVCDAAMPVLEHLKILYAVADLRCEIADYQGRDRLYDDATAGRTYARLDDLLRQAQEAEPPAQARTILHEAHRLLQDYRSWFVPGRALIARAEFLLGPNDVRRADLKVAIDLLVGLQFERAARQAHSLIGGVIPSPLQLESASDDPELPQLVNFSVRCDDDESIRSVDVPLNFSVVWLTPPPAEIPGENAYRWRMTVVGETRTEEPGGPTRQYRFAVSGEHQVEVALPAANSYSAHRAQVTINIRPSPQVAARMSLRSARRLTTFGTMAAAALAGLIYIQVFTDAFGAPRDYLLAFVWGLGADLLNRSGAGAAMTLADRVRALFSTSSPDETDSTQPEKN